jgi:hypothetical protein
LLDLWDGGVSVIPMRGFQILDDFISRNAIKPRVDMIQISERKK